MFLSFKSSPKPENSRASQAHVESSLARVYISHEQILMNLIIAKIFQVPLQKIKKSMNNNLQIHRCK